MTSDANSHGVKPEISSPTVSTAMTPPGSTSVSHSGGSSGQMSFRRQRASRACETCHSRKVRCDAARLGVPCTNCVAFEIECSIPVPRRKKGTGQRQSHPGQNARSTADIERTGARHSRSPVSGTQVNVGTNDQIEDTGQGCGSNKAGSESTTRSHQIQAPVPLHSIEGTPATSLTKAQAKKEEADSSTFVDLVMKPKFTRAPITEAGRVAYLGESSNLTLLVHDRQGSADVVHYPLPKNVRGSRARLTELDNVEIDILNQRGAFLLPPRALCDELIEAYFGWIHPIMPIINRTRFMRQYQDTKNPPSLLLLQAVLLAGSRVCNSPQLVDANGSTTPAALTFYKRAKALYDANYEDDRVTIVQSLLLMGWYWEGPEDSTANTFYYSRVATIVAQGSGMHRTVERSQLSATDKRLWKRIWWTLFTRDRSVAVALGRPVHINLDDSDVEMVTEEDFIEDEPELPSEYAPDPIHVQFFLQYVKLCEIMGLVLSQQYSVAFKGRPRTAMELSHSDMALADWLRNCPKSVYWEMPCHHFWSALLHSNYYTTLCLLHRAHMPPQGTSSGFPDQSVYPSRNIAFQAAAMITSIIENLSAHNELQYCPAFVVYSLFSALIMHVYQMRSPVPSIQQVTHDRVRTCMQALKHVSRVWLVGKMVHTLFESILGNKGMEERLQKAGGKRHKKLSQAFLRLEQHQLQSEPQHQQDGPCHDHPSTQNYHMSRQLQQQQGTLPPLPFQQLFQSQQSHHHLPTPTRARESRPHEGTKRKYDEMAVDFSISTPTPKESYERSRPQTPSLTARSQHMPPPLASPRNDVHHISDTFMGGSSSRPTTRPATPFNPSFSLPTTPPDLYLVTRNSPNLSQSIWENFQPDQLFPESASLPPHLVSSGTSAPFHDMSSTTMSTQAPGHLEPPTDTESHIAAHEANNLFPHSHIHMGTGSLGLYDAPSGHSGHSPDSWSSGSATGPTVPATLNVEDWYQFFGMNGDVGMYPDAPMA